MSSLFALLLVFAPAAAAHDVVVEADPGVDSTVSEFPRHINLVFSGVPRDTFNTVAVTNADSGELLFRGEPTLDGRNVSIDVPDDVHPGPGNYTIGFQITSSDGHSTRGMTKFSVSDSAPDDNTSAAQSEQESSSEGLSTPLVAGIVVLVILVLAGVAALVRGRRRGGQSSQF